MDNQIPEEFVVGTERTTYVLDTQALRSLRRGDIENAIAKGHDIAISPISIYEVLCHLDEVDENQQPLFARRRGLLLKASGARILDDPFAAHALAMVAGGSMNQTRLDDRSIVKQLLELLARSTTLTGFYQQEVQYPNGDRGLVSACAQRARDVLARYEQQYVRHIQKFAAMMETDLGRDKLRAVDDLDFIKFALGGARHLATGYDPAGAPSDELVSRVMSSTFLYLGYSFERARRCLLNVGPGRPIHVDGNDAEDSAIVLYLDVSEPRVLVTDDGGTQAAIRVACDRFVGASRAVGSEATIPRRVLTCEGFRAEVGIAMALG